MNAATAQVVTLTSGECFVFITDCLRPSHPCLRHFRMSNYKIKPSFATTSKTCSISCSLWSLHVSAGTRGHLQVITCKYKKIYQGHYLLRPIRWVELRFPSVFETVDSYIHILYVPSAFDRRVTITSDSCFSWPLFLLMLLVPCGSYFFAAQLMFI
jgi:hypothetical protein